MVTIKNPDQTTTTGFDTSPMARASEATPPWDDGDPAQAVCAMFAAQIALSRIVSGLRVTLGSFENLLLGTGSYGPTRTFKINNITLDMPASEDEIQPFNAAIIERSPQTYDEDIKPYMLKEQWNGYSLRVLGKTTISLGLACWFGHANERRAFRAALVRSLLAEPKREGAGRIIVVPEYYDRTVRLFLNDVQHVDDDAQANHRVLQASVSAYADEIVAINNPQKIKVQVMPEVGTTVQP